jgi:hypothetical protein
MLWFGKKNKNKEPEKIESVELQDDILFEEFVDNELTEEEIIEALSEEDVSEDTDISEIEVNESDEEYDDDDEEQDTEATEEKETEKEPAEIVVTTVVNSFTELTDYICKKPIGAIQYMRKDTKEAFNLSEAHFRIASVWGNVSMLREYTERDYAKITLAGEVMENPDAFYILPMLNDSETQTAIISFCMENFVENGKKYAKHPEKFAELIKENDLLDDWIDYIRGIVNLKLESFCKKNAISFDDMPVFEDEE